MSLVDRALFPAAAGFTFITNQASEYATDTRQSKQVLVSQMVPRCQSALLYFCPTCSLTGLYMHVHHTPVSVSPRIASYVNCASVHVNVHPCIVCMSLCVTHDPSGVSELS